ncbi:MAG: methyltransferase domain-containing protein [Elusimicrobia bacterium]|nr:methyltransferase domain-containing protein [Elusimicrobiota bacterium]
MSKAKPGTSNPSARIRARKDWWRKGFFDPSFYTPADTSHVAAAPAEVRGLLRLLKLRRGASILDLCCGPGRHSLLLAEKGFQVTGLDYSPSYIRQARDKARRAGLEARFTRGDMKELRFHGEFDAVLNLFTSFGYFDRWSDNLKTLQGAARALKPGGLFLMDVMNGDWLRKHFSRRSWALQDRGVYLLEDRELAAGGRRIKTRWIRIPPGGRAMERSFSLWLMDRKLLTRALRGAGLTPLRFFGSLRGDPLSNERNRLVVLASSER